MTTRNKLYYPKTHVVTNLYTSGKEFMLEDSTEYIGFFHRYIDGEIMSGAEYQRGFSKKLIPYVNVIDQPQTFIYDQLKKRVKFVSPTYSFPVLTIENYQEGKITRYFIKRRNFASYSDILEINKQQYNLWNQSGSGIDEKLYDAISLDWKLTGPLNDTNINGNVVYGVSDTNYRIVRLKDK